MFIRQAIYFFDKNRVCIKAPFEIERETEKCYYTASSRYLKSELNKPILRSATQYPYVEITMVDASEDSLRIALGQWFSSRALSIFNKSV